MTQSRTPVLLLAGTALVATATVGLAEPLAYTNETGGSAIAYGQVSPTFLGFDDGQESYSNIADNDNSNTRVGLFLDQNFSDDQTLRFNFETALGAPRTSGFSQDFEPIWEWQKTDLRKLELIYGSNWGRVFLGQGSMATDGTDGADLSRTTIAGSRAIGDTAGGYFFRQSDGDLSTVTIGTALQHYDGTRRMRVRYDTPVFGGRSPDSGFVFATSYGYDALNEDNDNIYYDVAAYYDEDYGSFAVSAAAGYGWTDDGDQTTENWSASLAALHNASGVNGALAAGGTDTGGTFFYAKAGWLADFMDVGATAMAIDYGQNSDGVYEGSEADKWGLQLVQNFDNLNLEAYLAYNSYGFSDDSDISYQDGSSTMAGVRWQF
jgi:hypothetical protein